MFCIIHFRHMATLSLLFSKNSVFVFFTFNKICSVVVQFYVTSFSTYLCMHMYVYLAMAEFIYNKIFNSVRYYGPIITKIQLKWLSVLPKQTEST